MESDIWILVPLSILLGLMVGSFSNVVIHRLPRGESVAWPASHCPACGHDIAWYDNIPVVSYLLLRGRCRHCRTAISGRYPLAEVAMGVTWGYLAWHFGWHPQLAMAMALATALWVLTWIDLETGLLPDAITLPGVAIGLGFSFWFGHGPDGIIGAVAGYGIFWLVAKIFLRITGREGMGYGDFKLLAMLGAFLGWQALPLIILLASVSGAVIGSLYLLLSRSQMQNPIPFGPYLALAGMIWLLWGPEWMHWYVGMMTR